MHSHIGRIAAGFLLAVLAQAQTSRGTVTGAVTDPSEGVVGRASVELVHIATGVRRRAITNAAGIYRFEAVDLGTYDVKIAHTGFIRSPPPGLPWKPIVPPSWMSGWNSAARQSPSK
jgi:hypothetical protein